MLSKKHIRDVVCCIIIFVCGITMGVLSGRDVHGYRPWESEHRKRGNPESTTYWSDKMDSELVSDREMALGILASSAEKK